jgi:hypothetical protein
MLQAETFIRTEDDMAQEGMSSDDLRAAASASMAGGEHIRERVRELTLQALRARKFDLAGMRDVMRSMTEGINLGAEKSGKDVRLALSEAFAGMDQAMSKVAQAASLAMKELADRGRDFSQNELKQGLDQMRRMETDFLDAVRQVSQSAAGTAKSEWQDLVAHAQRAGTDTGRVIAETGREFSSRVAASASESALAGMEAARTFGERFAALASGILAGMSEALRPDRDADRKP